ncbi:hypothetical protein U2P60_17695 [Brucella sp. H1_1004]|uniref:hypothetical protein n=1 Tax=Brucella sp. H1_1004 TaxID=3110109 RepID=UPI0039B3D552
MLGVLVAVFVVVLLGPSVWRRAFFLARRQIHAELPVTLAEIRADRDGLRAEHAVIASKLEQQLKLEREKSARQLIEIGQQHDELKHFATLESDMVELRETLSARDKRIAEITIERDNAAEEAEIVEAEVQRLQKHLSSLEELTDTLRIELSTKEADYGRLTNEMSEMRRERKDASARYNEVSTQLTAAQTELKSEKRRNTELQQKLDKLIADFSDAQERLERYARDRASVTGTPADILKENAALREEMAVLAARMVAATADKEGAASPINKLLDAEKTDNGTSRPKSLASRIRDLR